MEKKSSIKGIVEISIVILILSIIGFFEINYVLPVLAAPAGRIINWVTVDGGSATIVLPSSSVIVEISVTTSGSGSANDWESTSYQIEGGIWKCVNHGDHISSGTYIETFPIIAPSSEGVYDLSLRAFNDDGCSAGESDIFTLPDAITVMPPPECGNGALEAGEECDDGNNVNGDGCSSTCFIEYCGDGIINNVNEQCDDGNTIAGDGCSDVCQVETGWECEGEPSDCATINPTLTSSCGVDMVLIMDSSGSISNSELSIMKAAFKDFVDALIPYTPTQIAVVEFDTRADLIQSYTDDADAIKLAIDSAIRGGATNWEDALEEAHDQFDNRLDKPDLYIFASDGNPNRYGDESTSASKEIAVAEAVEDANEIKLDGVRIITLGIGDNLDPESLKAISSDDAYYETDFDILADTLSDIAIELCGGTITVKKLIYGDGAEGWEFTASVTGGSSEPVSGYTSTGGYITFEIYTDTYATVDITETVKSGYKLDSATCWENHIEVGYFNGVDTVEDIVTDRNDILYCEFDNVFKTYCGDDEIQSPNDDGEFEECDDGNNNDGDGCSGTCIIEYCGDSIINNVNEQCDDGIDNTDTPCDPPYGFSCTYCDTSCEEHTVQGEYCGDGTKNGPEECDGTDGVGPHQVCQGDCTLLNLTYCGDGIKQTPNEEGTGGPLNDGYEECDGTDGVGEHQECTINCELINLTYCGDGEVQTPNDDGEFEECDVGEQNGAVCDPPYSGSCQWCNLTCALEEEQGPYCGDGEVNGPEECDDGNEDNDDLCSNDCTLTFCGDGVVQNPNGVGTGGPNDDGYERCDDGNNNNWDTCSNDCDLVKELFVTAIPPEALGGTFDFDPLGGVCQDPAGTYTTPRSFKCLNDTEVKVSNAQVQVGLYFFKEYSIVGDFPAIITEDNITVLLDPDAAVALLYLLDENPPLTTKIYDGPFFQEGDVEWITSNTSVILEAEDQDPPPSGVKATYYRNIYLENEADWHYCYLDCETWDPVEPADPLDPTSEGWIEYEEPFHKEPESCHIIEYYSVDNVDRVEDIKWQCVFVDNTSPEPSKIIGEPKTGWDGKNANFYDIVDKCWNESSEEYIECWEVTLLTPITLNCTDQGPHPVNHERVCFRVECYATDVTEDYCTEYEGYYDEMGDGFCCLGYSESPREFYFGEETEHELEYYCVDALENTGPIDIEKFKVEGVTFDIELNKKWNLISVPLVVQNDSIEEVFKDIEDHIIAVWTYDGETEEWYVYVPGEGGTLTEMIPGWGYWVKALEPTLLKIGGSLFSPAKTPPDKKIIDGWNLIGYYGTEELFGYFGPDLEGNGETSYCTLYSLVDTIIGHPRWSSLVTYWEPDNPDQWKYLGLDDYMNPGAGYWLEIDVDDVYRFSTICGFII